MKYSEYFSIDPTYYPEINPDSVKDPRNRWQSTYPHKTFIELLEAAERMLARETGRDKHGIWVEGSYGTGKSRVVWTLQNLLTCPEAELREYFSRPDALRRRTDLMNKFLAHKEGKIITVSRYGSGEIGSIRQLITAVYDSVTKAMKAAGMDYLGQRTLRGRIADWIAADETHKQFFEQLLKKPEYRGCGSFSGKSADDIVNQLLNLDVGADALLNDILLMADKEGITMFEISMDDLRDWLTDIIDKNDLKAIVFFWDEFSSFFKNNRSSLDVFQKLAELSESKPFYLVIVTHMSRSLVSPAEQGAFRIVYDRFTHSSIEMPDNIAFELISDAMRLKEGPAQDEYRELTNELNDYMTEPRKAVCEQTHISDEVMRRIFPIHPMAALLLKHISTSFASNQRSMFNFIKNDDSDHLQAFQWFINNHSPDDSQILTIDYLWNFFYEKGTDENTSATGRSNLDSAIATILDTYPSNESKLSSQDEKRVLKTVLMMQAISKKLNNAVELFRPTDKNIQLAFQGDDSMENGFAINIIQNKLLPSKILYINSDGRVKEYASAAVAADQVQIDAIQDRLRKETKTATLLSAGKIREAFNFPVSIGARYAFTDVTVDNFTISINRMINEPQTYQFRGVICYARNEEEQKRIHSLIEDAVKQDACRDITLIDASANIMGLDRFDRYIEVAAQEEYWRPKDSNLANDKQRNKEELLGEWKAVLENGNFVVYKSTSFKKPCGSMKLLNEALADLVLKGYPLSFDNAKVSNNFFTSGSYADAAKRGIRLRKDADFTRPGLFTKEYVQNLMGDVIGCPNYVQDVPNSSVSRIKVKLDKMIQDTFQTDVRISIGTIYDYLMSLGFMPCALYAFLAGFLLSEYSEEPYRFSVGIAGDNGGVMTPETLGDYIGEYIKHKISPIRNYKEKYIEIMTQNQKRFVDFAHDAFGIPESLSVEQAASRMRVRLRDIGYPVWCFKCIDTNNLEHFIDKLADIANAKTGEAVPALAGQLGEMLNQVPTASSNMAALITEENGPRAMLEFLQHEFENGALLSVAASIGIQNVVGDVKRQIGSGEASWLWDKTTGMEELRKLLVDYKIILKSNGFESVSSSSSFFSCMQAWREYSNFLKIPYSVCKAKIPELSCFFDCLKNIAEDCDLSHDKHEKFLAELEVKASAIDALKKRKMDVFKEEYAIYLAGFGEKEILKLYSKLPGSSYLDDKSAYEQNMSREADAIRMGQERFKLMALWESLTQTTTPHEWCSQHQMSIRAMVPPAELQNASKMFRAIDYNNADKADVTFALDYLSRKPAFVAELSDADKIETAFVHCIIGRYAAILTDNGEVRRHLCECVPESYDQWYGSPAVAAEIKKLAGSKYQKGGNRAVVEKIDHMKEDEAKALLKRLVTDDVEVGISIISKEGE